MTQQQGQPTSYPQRLEIGERAAAGACDRAIAQSIGCSIWTVRKWRRIYARQGAAGLVTRLGRPAGGALAQCAPGVRAQIVQLRQSHPGWGAPSILDALRPQLAGARLPSVARVAAFLKAQGLTRVYERHGGVRGPAPASAAQPHDEWELDAQGAQAVAGLGLVSLVNISDVVSRLKVASYPHLGGHLDTDTYQRVLRVAFVEYGLPCRITLDHDSAWYDSTTASPFPSRLHLWLVALGIEVLFITQPPPQAHAIIERMHQTLSRQALYGQTYTSPRQLWYRLEQRRTALNQRLPCRSLGHQAPLQVYPEAATPARPYRLECEADLLELPRIDHLLGTGRWFRRANCYGEFCLSQQRYNQGKPSAGHIIQITFDPETRTFLASTAGTGYTKRFTAEHLTKTDLIGSPHSQALPDYQFSLPFPGRDWLPKPRQPRGTTL